MTDTERTFQLYDLRVEIVSVEEGLEDICNHHIGDYFEVSGENIRIPDGKTFSMYAMAAVLPLLPAKQRPTNENDWMTSDDRVMCPDPNCKAVMKITRTGLREFRRAQVTATP
ncbi:MAG: TIGR04076 family protein [Trueperaceae bacterium]